MAVTRGMEILANGRVDRTELTAIAVTSLAALPVTGDGSDPAGD
ncbi:hypothetical protein [Gordonia metallireducens]|nr:hypothetical protein [Gordonia metallireducens]